MAPWYDFQVRRCSVKGCVRPLKARGLCNTHYEARRTRGEFPVWLTDPTERFWSKVNKRGAGGCWLWAGSTGRGGYGQYFYDGRMRKPHRIAYELLVGPIPEGLQLDHLCSVRTCVNPTHLEP